MIVGIAGPIELDSFIPLLDRLPSRLPKGLGGSNVNNLIHGLLNLNNSVIVYTLDPQVVSPISLTGPNLKIYIGKYRTPARKRMFDFFAGEAEQLNDFILKDPPDIVHAQWSYEFALGALQSKVPHLITLHDAPLKILALKKDLYRFIRLLIHFRVIKNGKHFTAVSPYLSKQCLMPPIDRIIGNPILTMYIKSQPRSIRSNKVKIVSCLNGWSQLKNPIPSLLAFKTLQKKYQDRIEYHLYGIDYESKGPAEQWTRDAGILNGICFHGQVPHKELMQRLPNYDILLHPSLEESFGNTLVEAMAAGVPVIAGKESGAVPWILEQGKSGKLVDVRSPHEIVQGIETLLQNPAIYQNFSERGLFNVRLRFNHLHIAQQYIDYYREILKQTNS